MEKRIWQLLAVVLMVLIAISVITDGFTAVSKIRSSNFRLTGAVVGYNEGAVEDDAEIDNSVVCGG